MSAIERRSGVLPGSTTDELDPLWAGGRQNRQLYWAQPATVIAQNTTRACLVKNAYAGWNDIEETVWQLGKDGRDPNPIFVSIETSQTASSGIRQSAPRTKKVWVPIEIWLVIVCVLP